MCNDDDDDDDDDDDNKNNNNTRIITIDALRTKQELRQSPFAKTINSY